MKKLIAILLMLVCIAGLGACAKQNAAALHLGVNAAIQEIHIGKNQIVVSGTDENSPLGEDCVISCDNMIYCSYQSSEIKQISMQDLQIGDDVILEIKDTEAAKFLADHGVLKVEQLQLGTQRLH